MTAWHKASDKRKLVGRPWRRLREQVMARDLHLCVTCRAAGRIRQATEVDHITPVAKGGSDNPANLQSLCADCHQAKTIADAGGRPKVTIGLDGWPVAG